MKKYGKYSALFIMLLVAITYSTPSLIGETSSETVLVDNSDFSANLKLTALDSATIYENENYDLFTLLNVNANRVDSDGAITSLIDQVSYETDLDPTVPGTYTVKFTVADDLNGTVADKTATIYVENIEPTLDVSTQVVTVMEGDELNYLSDFGVTASEFTSGDLNSQIQVLNDVDTSVPGSHEVNFEVADAEGAVARQTANVEVQTYTATITANNVEYAADEMVTASKIMADANVQAQDYWNNPLSGEWIEAPNGFDYNNLEVGTYTFEAKVRYGYKDRELAMTTFTVTITEPEVALEPMMTVATKTHTINVSDPVPTLNDLIGWYGPEAIDFSEQNPMIDFEFVSNHSEFSTEHPITYSLRFYAYDGEQKVSSETVVLHVKKDEDNKSPVLTIPETEKTIDEVASLTDANILDIFKPVATDKEDEDSTLMFTLDYDRMNFDSDHPGTYEITIIVTDSEGATDSEMVQLIIRDLLPEFVYEHDSVTITLGDEVDYLADFGVNATEKMSGDLTDEIDVYPPTINGAGTYTVRYEVEDGDGNHAQTLELTLIVEEPYNNPPVITGLEDVTINETNDFINLRQLFDINVTDIEDDTNPMDELKTKVVVKSGPLKAQTPGEYFVQIEVTDSGGKKAYFTGTLHIIDVLPEITTDITSFGVEFDSEPLTYEDFVTTYGIHASELMLDDIIESLAIDDSEVMYDQAGMYPVYLTATDEEGNEAPYTIYVVVGEPPLEIAISSKRYAKVPEEIAVTKEQLIELYNMVASTSLLDMINQYITIEGSFNVDVPDVYDLRIVVEYMDLYKEFDIQLEVVDSLPKIDADLVSLNVKDTDKMMDLISRFGIHASEVVDGDLTDYVMVDTSSVMTKDGRLVPGNYPVVFTAIDEEGNEAMVTTALNVEDTTKQEEDPVVDEEDPVVDEEDPVVDEEEDPVVDEEDPVVDEEDPVALADKDPVALADNEVTEANSTKVMTLAETGGVISNIIVILGFALAIIIMIKAGVVTNRK